MAKQGLNKIWILKDQLGLICEGRKEPVEREGREEEEEEEEEEKKKEGSSQDQAKRGMETHPDHESYVIMHEFPCFDGYNVAQI